MSPLLNKLALLQAQNNKVHRMLIFTMYGTVDMVRARIGIENRERLADQFRDIQNYVRNNEEIINGLFVCLLAERNPLVRLQNGEEKSQEWVVESFQIGIDLCNETKQRYCSYTDSILSSLSAQLTYIENNELDDWLLIFSSLIRGQVKVLEVYNCHILLELIADLEAAMKLIEDDKATTEVDQCANTLEKTNL